jgi:3-hydroxy acid dehydrogenase/malonic semialdehyde reductase
MCNNADGNEGKDIPGRVLPKKGVLLIAESPALAGAIVGKLAEEGATVLVVTAAAVDLSQLLSRTRGSPGTVHGMAVDLGRKTELERVFRWVDGTLVSLDVMVVVVAETPVGEPGADWEAWHQVLERRWVMPLLLLEGAAIRMRAKRRGHILQVAIREGDARLQSGESGSEQTRGPMWWTLREMLEARREGLRSTGVNLTILEVEGHAAGRPSDTPTASEGKIAESCPSPEDVALAVQFCLHRRPHALVEAIRLRMPCFG